MCGRREGAGRWEVRDDKALTPQPATPTLSLLHMGANSGPVRTGPDSCTLTDCALINEGSRQHWTVMTSRCVGSDYANGFLWLITGSPGWVRVRDSQSIWRGCRGGVGGAPAVPIACPGQRLRCCPGIRAEPILESILELVVPQERQSSHLCTLTMVAAGQGPGPSIGPATPASTHNL